MTLEEIYEKYDLFKLVGQDNIKTQLSSQLTYCVKNKEPLPHSLLIASAGQGKTTFANAIMQIVPVLNKNAKTINVYGPSIQTKEDLLQIFVKNNQPNLLECSAVFIDEIHAIPYKILEMLYTIQENFSINLNDSKVSLPKFTLLGGTTEPQLLPKPLIDRFINVFTFEPYSEKQIVDMLWNNNYHIILDYEMLPQVAKICKYTPRLVQNFLVKARMYMKTKNWLYFDKKYLDAFLYSIGYNRFGLTPLEVKYLKILGQLEKASAKTLASILGLKTDMITSIIEPSLITAQLIELSIVGRKLTEEGKNLLPLL